MKVILAIKPEFAKRIFEGTKKFEFRRVIFKNRQIKKVLVYASAPVSRIIGEFEIETILKDDLNILWNKTRDFSGVSEEYYYKYFSGKKEGYALKIKKTNKFRNQICIKKDLGLFPPQSFIYYREKSDDYTR